MYKNIGYLKELFVLAILVTINFTILVSNASAAPTIREYWVAAEAVLWDFAPSGMNKIKPAEGLGPWGVTTKYNKLRYIEYSDGTYTNPVPQPLHRGILGPEFRAIEGDIFHIHFLNKTTKPLSMHPHGVRYDNANDGADFALTGEPGAKVMPGDSFTYTWYADKGASPGPNDPSSIVWVYHSHVDSVTEIYDGLIGTIVVTKKGEETSKADPRPKGVDKSFTTLYMVFDEENGAEGGLMHSMNGYIFGNLEGLETNVGDKVRWHLIGMGTEVDLHTAHWHGQTVLEQGRRTDVVELLPTSMKSVDMKSKNEGTWLYHCHVTDHITAGMMARWTVLP